MFQAALINLCKPRGMSSRGAVDCVVRAVRPLKVGHAGTLDPLAEGVLVVCLGAATRLIPYVQRMPKAYRATFQLGVRSVTDDVESELVPIAGTPIPTDQEIRAALPEFIGEIPQRPPNYSAIKVAGRRAYRLARKGREFSLPARLVRIDALRMVRYAAPELVLDIECGSGTYVRALGRDLAERLGTGAVMSALVRQRIGGFTLETAVDPRGITRENVAQAALEPLRAVVDLPRCVVGDAARLLLLFGRPLALDIPGEPAEVAAVDERGRLLAIVTPLGPGLWHPTLNFAHEAADSAESR